MAYPAAKSGFTLEDLTKMGPDEITRKRKLAEALLAESQGIRRIEHPLEGMAQMAQALIGNLKGARLDRAEREGKEGANALFSAGMGVGEFPPAPGAKPSGSDYSGVTDAAPGGMDSYLSNIRSAESGGSDSAANPHSSARGRYQFLGGTWQEMMRTHPELGLTPDGRGNPEQEEKAIRAFTADNAKVLSSAGIPLTGGNLYAAHFLGSGGAAKVLRSDPSASVAAIVGNDVVSANPFLRGMTVADFSRWAAKKGGNSAVALDGSAPAAPAQVASLDPAIGMPPAAMLPPTGGAPGQEAIAKALLGAPAAPNLPGATAALNVPGVSDQGLSVAPIPNATPLPAGVDPRTMMDPAAQVPLPTQPGGPAAQAPMPQQQQMAQALIQPQDPAQTLGAPAIQPQGPDMGTLMNMAGNEFMSPQQQKMIEALTGRRMELADPANQLDMEMKREQLKQLRGKKQKNWQKLDDNTLFDADSGETMDIGAAGGPPKFEGTSMDAQAWNILQTADPSSREYATAYSIVSQPKTQLIQTENGMMPVEVPPQLPAWLQAPGAAGANAAPAASPSAREAFDAAAGVPPAAQPDAPVIPGTKKPPTEIQIRNGAIGKILLNEVPTLGANFKALSDPKGQLLSKLPAGIGNMWQSEEYQRAANSVKTSISNVLYSLSGASSNPGEVVKQIEVLTPEFGDKPGAIADKLQRFKTYVRAISSEANDPELTRMVEEAIAGMDTPAEPTGADAEGWKELAPGVKIRPKAQ